MALLVVAGASTAVVIVAGRARMSAMVDSEFERLNRLGQALTEYARSHEGELPSDLSALSVGDISTLTIDVATGQPITYRIDPPSGERIRYQFIGDRFVAWSPDLSYRGRRAILLNSGDVRFATDDVLDMSAQRLLVTDALNAMRPKMEMASGADDEEEESEEMKPTTAPDEAPATAPG